MPYSIFSHERVWLECGFTKFSKLRCRIVRRPYAVNARPERHSFPAILIDRRHTGDIPLPERSELRRDHQVERVEVDLVLDRHKRLDLAYKILFGIQVNFIQEPHYRAYTHLMRRDYLLPVEQNITCFRKMDVGLRRIDSGIAG